MTEEQHISVANQKTQGSDASRDADPRNEQGGVDTTEKNSTLQLELVRHEIYALAKAAVASFPDKTFPDYLLYLRCVDSFERHLAKIYIHSYEKRENPDDALKAVLERLASDADGVLSNLFANYGRRLDKHEMHNHESTAKQARYVHVDAKGQDHVDLLRLDTVEMLLSKMASMLPKFHINKRIGMDQDADAAVNDAFDNLRETLGLND
ncbi:hypothetical protein A3C37_03115 [Candidatus Peribacteria bacterium RIFCSPHIGHO2_02_FULL_53_20]|nr:MAG: hypothetical protein A3C37_03115 [Candidatus Peribacteria bacterium RIFCSPHIGHO2_02_FULL_53_20]OGJ68025.1 MAG: hypothetical protein A3B61_00275 [Candidatus Peribacteria bacterium RIFCSPLOWO2_01_FULL_53_10]OGJ73297.1 MAG: hypothetical protein A3G69_01050 [Candidatus Peribacteria bacterium RIFCSPLOWO2_12_FULL_53_10]